MAEWISVNDRMPEKNSTVIAADDNGIVFQCLYAYDGWDLWKRNTVNITHWMPLPEPPKRRVKMTDIEQKIKAYLERRLIFVAVEKGGRSDADNRCKSGRKNSENHIYG